MLAFLKPLPEEVVKPLLLERVQMGDKTATLARNNDGLDLATGPGQ